MSTRKNPRRPQGTRWTWTPPDDSSSPQERRTDSRDDRTRTNATIAERRGTSRGNAPNPRRPEFHGESHTERRKPPTKEIPKKKIPRKKNRRETTALGNKPQQQPPEGETSCRRRRPTLPDSDNQVRPRGKNHDQGKDPRKQWDRTNHHCPGRQRGIGKLYRQSLRRGQWDTHATKNNTTTSPNRGWK